MKKPMLFLLFCAIVGVGMIASMSDAVYAQTPNSSTTANVTSATMPLNTALYSATADSSKRMSFGVFGGYNLNMHRANFLNLPGITKRTDDKFPFGNASGGGFTAGALVEIPFSDKLALSLRAAFSTNNAELQAPEPQRIGVLSADGSSVTFFDGQIGYSITPTLTNVVFEPLLAITPFDGALANLRFLAGVRAGLYLSPKYVQVEKLLQPSDATALFQNGSKERNSVSGDIPNAQAFNLSAVAGIGYDIPIPIGEQSAALIISPEVLYSYNFTPVVTGLSWNVDVLRAGVSVRYMLPIPPVPPPPPPPPPPIPKLEAHVQAFGIDTLGVESSLVKIRIEEFVSRQLYPMLGFVFFDANSSAMLEKYNRYKKDVGSFDDEVDNFSQRFYNSDMMKVYYDVLNIIGNRMKDKPKTKITLIGCNDNSGSEEGNLSLSYQRALTIRKYLTDIWDVDTSRVGIKVRNLPELPTKSVDSVAGSQENRRVEIQTDFKELLEPLLVYDTLAACSIQKIRFKLSSKAEAGYAKAKLRSVQGSKELTIYQSPGKDEDSYVWNIADDFVHLPRTEEEMVFTYQVTDTRGEAVEDDGNVPVEQVTIRKKRANKVKDRTVDTYRLISFDFNATGVGERNGKIIKEFIKPNIAANSRISVVGYTDRLGNGDLNQRLSDGRSKSVADAIGNNGKITSFGVGARKPLYNNETPEGRFYNRTVEVRVETVVD